MVSWGDMDVIRDTRPPDQWLGVLRGAVASLLRRQGGVEPHPETSLATVSKKAPLVTPTHRALFVYITI